MRSQTAPTEVIGQSSHPPQSDPSIVRVQLDHRAAGADVEIEIALVDASSDVYWKVRVDAAPIGPRFDGGRECSGRGQCDASIMCA